jgi:hypothetical protein
LFLTALLLWRLIPLVAREAASASNPFRSATVDGLDYPPWEAGADEVAASDSAPFANCNALIDVLAMGLGRRVSERRCFTCSRWGHVVRARIANEPPGADTLLTCWSDASGPARVVVKIDAPDIRSR